MTNGKGTFYSLKRELTFGDRMGSIRSMGELVAVHELLSDELQNMIADVQHWMQEEVSINAHLDALHIERDSRVEGHGQDAVHVLCNMRNRLIGVYRRDLSLIEAFLSERGIAL